jgi:GNAT superfamily N-acetyltransferase
LPAFRRRGIASQLLAAAEERAAERSAVVGIGVGMTADYGAAQRLYVRAWIRSRWPRSHHRRPAVQYGERVRVDDDLVMYFTRAPRG